MTERQIREVLYHRRDKNGILTAPAILPPGKAPKKPRFPRSMEEELRQIAPLAGWVSQENYAEMVATIKERWKTGVRDGRPKR